MIDSFDIKFDIKVKRNDQSIVIFWKIVLDQDFLI